MKQGSRTAALLLLAAAIGLAALGQHYFFNQPEYRWDGLVLHLLAAACFILAWRQARVRRPDPHSTRTRVTTWRTWIRSILVQSRPIPTMLVGLGLMLSLTASWISLSRAWNQHTGDVVGLWLLGLGAVVVAALWPTALAQESVSDWRGTLRRLAAKSRVRVASFDAAAVVGLAVLAFSVRVASLDTVPFTVGGDEAWHGLLARQVLQHELQNPFVMGYMSMPTFFYWPLSWSLWLAGDTVTGLRLPAALAGAVTVPILYAFARRLWDRRLAFLAALFLATYDYHIHYSRLGANNVWDPLFVLLTLWLLDLGLDRRGMLHPSTVRYWTFAGLVMGISFYFYTGARLLPFLVAAYLVFLWIKAWRQGRGRAQASALMTPLIMLVLAILIAAGPMISYALSHPNEWNARINQVGILQSGWLAREPEITGKSTAHILAEQFLRAAGAFHVFPDRTVWYGATRPLLGFLGGIFAILGMAWSLIRWQERRYFLLLIWFWSVIITGGMLTESPPSSQRLVIAIPAVSLLVAIGLERSVALARWLLHIQSRTLADAVLGMLVLLLTVESVHFYFVDYTPARSYGSRNGETATMIGHYLRDLDAGYDAYFFGAPRIYWSFGTMEFLAPSVPGVDVVEPLSRRPDFVDEGRKAVFVFLPERAGEALWVQEAYPGGTVREIHGPDGRLRFIAYEVEPQ